MSTRISSRSVLGMWLAFAAIMIAASGCAPDSPRAESNAKSNGEAKVDSPPRKIADAPPLVISVASSAATTVESLAKEFTRETGVEVKVNSGGSNALAGQILEGAPADLFLFANVAWATKVTDAGLATRSLKLLTNDLVLIVPKGNPAGVREPSDLLGERVTRVALAGEKVPAGMYADQALSKLGLLEPLTGKQRIARGQDVRATLRFVARGEAEAGIVYSTDVRGESDVETVHTFDAKLYDEIAYVLVQLKGTRPDDAASRLFEFLTGAKSDAGYAQSGFRRVPAAPVASSQ